MARDPRIDAYLEALPEEQRVTLQHVREHVAGIVPEAVETISYGMPAFRLDGRFLVSFAGWKAHCSIYPLTDSFMAAHAGALQGYRRTKGSLHFAPGMPLPDALLDVLVRARVADLEGGRSKGRPPGPTARRARRTAVDG